MSVLVEMAVPLFIFAATLCRFVEDPAWSDPTGQLKKLLEYRQMKGDSEMDKLDATYSPILNQLIHGCPEKAQKSLVERFRRIVGTIVHPAEPVSRSSLASLLNIDSQQIEGQLSSLHSVLSVPSSAESPIRMLHFSFRNFLIAPEKRHTDPFWVERRKLTRWSWPNALKECPNRGFFKKIYATCRAKGHYELRSMAEFLDDAMRFIRKNISVIDQASLQLYASALIFTPKEVQLGINISIKSLVGFRDYQLWDPATGILRQTLDGHSDSVWGVAFSPDGKLVASGSYDETVKLWDPATGTLRQTLVGHSGWVGAVAFSPDGKFLETD
ncbi:sulfur metabolite repression control protein, putative [Talaromyces stipitatus ATCC 10500]|uniref:Sulfur metabolite repression control protein, putative n=1 Tax=Talaromyces stipitatus (strain ATCC 10500 / CBS 375.48 / QM 6759 / NRRL 1006) TaxID=441959 RepID=B8MEN2_TALSN|nr:sulfur metabolite repression control protein, putative [Talaromyces stipitatus ATCC 10500]EED16915.1 sulfur metabolite repression control protein, putative [Talaromyces stipitatus ATCC 10500]